MSTGETPFPSLAGASVGAVSEPAQGTLQSGAWVVKVCTPPSLGAPQLPLSLAAPRVGLLCPRMMQQRPELSGGPAGSGPFPARPQDQELVKVGAMLG